MTFQYLYLILFSIIFILGLILNNYFLNKIQKKHLIKKTEESAVRFSSQSKPIYGGISFYILFVITSIASLFICKNTLFITNEYIVLFIIVTISFIMGLADDIMSTSPLFKFLIQILCALVLFVGDIYIVISPNIWINLAITIFWVVGIMNSINMLDNMDAITSSVSLSIITGACIYGLIYDSSMSNYFILILITCIASLLSFLFFNWAPAKMYMGDNGSQFIGIILAYLGIALFWNKAPVDSLNSNDLIKQLIIIFLAFIIPICDTTTVTINRLLKKKSPFSGDKNHTTHHLYYMGIPVQYISIIFLIINSIGVFLALFIIHNNTELKTALIYAIYPIVIFAILYTITKITKPK